MNQEQFDIIQKYKTNRCTNLDCKYNQVSLSPKTGDGLMQYDCCYFHSQIDHRRPVLHKNKASKNYSTNYSPYLALTCLTEEDTLKHCLNEFEYLYHPLNFKRIECQLNKNQKCNTLYCPYYHTAEDEKFFQEFRKELKKQTSHSPPLIDDFKQILKNFTEGLLKASVIVTYDENVDKPRDPVKSKDAEKVKNGFKRSAEKKFKTVDGYYVYDQTVDIIEDHHHEFKNLKLNLETVTKYICGFLNSKGGTLYFGINDSGVIKGIEVNDKQIQSFSRKLRSALTKFKPPVLSEEEVKIDYVPVVKRNAKVLNTYIVEIQIVKENSNELYFNNHKECYIKRSASINQLKNKDIKEYVKDIIRRNNNLMLESMAKKVEMYEGKELEKVNKSVLDGVEKSLRNTLKLLEGIKFD